MPAGLSFSSFASPLQRQVSIASKSRATVWSTSIPTSYVGFLGLIGTDLPAANTFFLFYIDNSLVDTVNYQIGHPNRPLPQFPPFFVKSNILWVGVNNTGSTQPFTVFNDGVALPVEEE